MNMGPMNIPGHGISGQGHVSSLTSGQSAQETQRSTPPPLTPNSNQAQAEVAKYTPATAGTPSQAAVIIAEFMAATNSVMSELKEKAEYLKKKGIKTRIILDADGNPVLEIFDNTGNINERYKDTDGDAKMEERDNEFRTLLRPGNPKLAGVLDSSSGGMRGRPAVARQKPQVAEKQETINIENALAFVQVQLVAKGFTQKTAIELYYGGMRNQVAKELDIRLPELPEPEVNPLQMAAKFFKAAFLPFKKNK
jgi:hypothetical protein